MASQQAISSNSSLEVAASTSFDNITEMMTYANITMNMPETTVFTGRLGYGELELYTLWWVAYYINRYYLWVYFFLGWFGNIACIITIVSIRPISSSMVYIATLAVVDSLALLDKLLYLNLVNSDVDMKNVGCKTLAFFGTFFMMYSSWILVAVTFERFIATSFPLKATSLCTVERARMVVIALAVFFIGVNFHFFFTMEDNWAPIVERDCGYVDKHQWFMIRIWYWIDGLFFALIPILFLGILNALIISAVRRATNEKKRMMGREDELTETRKQVKQITAMLISVSVAFVVLQLPNCVFFIAQFYWNYDISKFEYIKYWFTMQIIFVLSDFNHCINFYLYVLSGKKFREKFLQIFGCRGSNKSTKRDGTLHYVRSSIQSTDASTTSLSTIKMNTSA